MGNVHNTYVTLGASNHVLYDRAEHDYYATDPYAARCLLNLEPDLSDDIWECAAGELHIAEVLQGAGKRVRCSDIVCRKAGVEPIDFLEYSQRWRGDIVTNPPYKHAQEFVEHALSIVDQGRLVCMFLKLTFLEGKKRQRLFDAQPPIRVWVSRSRLSCWYNGVRPESSSAIAYAWFVWKKGFQGHPEIRWFN